jgi:hypothetical protein
VINSRTEGALRNFWLVSLKRLSAEFARYNESDPLYCPTRTSHVTYEVSRVDSEVQQVETNPDCL